MGLTTTRSLAQNSYNRNFVVNRELRMGTGKTAAQVAHACLSLYTQLTGNSNLRTHYNAWLLTGQTKVVLQCDTIETLYCHETPHSRIFTRIHLNPQVQ